MWKVSPSLQYVVYFCCHAAHFPPSPGYEYEGLVYNVNWEFIKKNCVVVITKVIYILMPHKVGALAILICNFLSFFSTFC